MASTRSRSPLITPSVASLWPAMPFVAECSDRCTPCASGCWPSGVANVESTTVNGPRSAPNSSRSTSSSRGFDGVSASTSIVRPGRTAAANAPGAVPSTNVTSMPKRAHGPCRNASVAAYRLRWATMWSPWLHSASTTDAIAPMPLANASDASAPSSCGDGILERLHGRVAVAAVELAPTACPWLDGGRRSCRRSATRCSPTAPGRASGRCAPRPPVMARGGGLDCRQGYASALSPRLRSPAPMSDGPWRVLYRTCRERIMALVTGAGSRPETSWCRPRRAGRVHDVVAHVAGVASDARHGNMAGAPRRRTGPPRRWRAARSLAIAELSSRSGRRTGRCSTGFFGRANGGA